MHEAQFTQTMGSQLRPTPIKALVPSYRQP